jgi:hypothetical protein
VSPASLDLPDPFDPHAAPAGEADDLLSRLAGAQIDRMLRDAPPQPEAPVRRSAKYVEPPPPPPMAPLVTAEEHAALAAVLDDAVEEKLPVALRPLSWINAPFAAMTPAARQRLGRVGILLLLNAIAVLLYLFAFER